MKSLSFARSLLFLALFCIVFQHPGNARAENLGLYGIDLKMDLYGILDKAIEKGFRVKIYGSNLDPTYASKMFQLSYQYEIANEEKIDQQFGSDHVLYKIITNKEEIKYAKGFTVYNFLNDKGNRVGSFIFEDNLYFINKNKFGNMIIPVKLYKENITIDMICHNMDDKTYKPLFYAVSFFKEASVVHAIEVLNQRFGHYIDLKGENISARYWQKDGVSVSNYFGLNDRFVFYNIDQIVEYNKKENSMLDALKTLQQTEGRDRESDLKKLHEMM